MSILCRLISLEQIYKNGGKLSAHRCDGRLKLQCSPNFFHLFLLKGSRELMDFYNLMPLCVNGSPKFMKIDS